jgi:hypothetical protein
MLDLSSTNDHYFADDTTSVRGAALITSPLCAEWLTHRTSSQFCSVAVDLRDFPEAVYANEKA